MDSFIHPLHTVDTLFCFGFVFFGTKTKCLRPPKPERDVWYTLTLAGCVSFRYTDKLFSSYCVVCISTCWSVRLDTGNSF